MPGMPNPFFFNIGGGNQTSITGRPTNTAFTTFRLTLPGVGSVEGRKFPDGTTMLPQGIMAQVKAYLGKLEPKMRDAEMAKIGTQLKLSNTGMSLDSLGLSNFTAQLDAAGGANAPLSELSNAFQQAHDEANQANEERYQQLLGSANDLRDRVLGGLEGLGDAAKAEISDIFTGRKSAASQDLVSRGLSGTTIRPTVLTGVDRQEAGALNSLNEQLRRERLGYDIDLTQAIQGIIERRTDEGPDMNQFMQLANMLGQAGGGVPGGIPGAGGAGGNGSINPLYNFASAFNLGTAPGAYQVSGNASVGSNLPLAIPGVSTKSAGASGKAVSGPGVKVAAPSLTSRPGTSASGNRNGIPMIQLDAKDEKAIAGLSDAEKAAYFQKIKGVAAPMGY